MISDPTKPIEDFRRFMEDHGLAPADPSVVQATGKLTRYQVRGDKPGSKAGAFTLYSDGRPAGFVMSWKTGGKHTWSQKNGSTITAAQKKQIDAAILAARRERDREKREREEAALVALRRAESVAKNATNSHPYLTRKGVPAVDGLLRHGDALLVLARDADGTLQTAQTITQDGEKRYWSGCRITGAFFTVGTIEGAELAYITEGLATGITVHQATGKAVLVAFDCGNLAPVATAVAGKYPGVRFTIAGDNDRNTEGNPGRAKAEAAAAAIATTYTLPTFEDGEEGSDFNDLAALHGLEAVRACMEDGPAIIPEGKPKVALTRTATWGELVRGVLPAVRGSGELFTRGGEPMRIAKNGGMKFEELTQAGACSFLEEHVDFVTPGKEGEPDLPARISEGMARVIVAAGAFRDGLPRVSGVSDYRCPVWSHSAVKLSPYGLHAETGLFTDPDGPSPLEMPVEEGVSVILDDLLGDFCFSEIDGDKGAHYRMAAVAYLLTNHCKHLFTGRAPIFYASANRQGCGKDLLLGLGPALTTGAPCEFRAPSTNSDETRKAITAALRAGARSIVWSNWKRHLDDPALEAAATSEIMTDRILGHSEQITLRNDAVYALSGNGLSYSADMARRMIEIRLAYFGEDIDERVFRHKDLARHAIKNRARYLGALQALVVNWTRKGYPRSDSHKASFVDWSERIGGIMEAAGLLNPVGSGPRLVVDCEEENHVLLLLAELYSAGEGLALEARDLRKSAVSMELFGFFGDLESDRKAQTRFGRYLHQIVNRVFPGGYALEELKKDTRRKYFTVTKRD